MIKVFEAFAGYGSQSMALRRLGIDFEVVGISEIDKYAIQAYMAVHGETMNYGDISKIDWDSVPDFDFLTYSFPCTDISTAGQQKGLAEGSGTRSSLLWECRKAIVAKRPKYLLMENVKNLVSKKFTPYLQEWLNFLQGQGYTNYTKVLNAKDFGVPQNRERVFMVSILDGESFHFPKPFTLEKRLKDVLEKNVDESFYLSEKIVNTFLARNEKNRLKGNGFKFEPTDGNVIACTVGTHPNDRDCDNYVYVVGNTNPSGHGMNGNVFDTKGLSPTLTTNKDEGPRILEESQNKKYGNKAEPRIKRIGCLNSSQDGVVVDIDGISKCLTSGHSNTPKIMESIEEPKLFIKQATKKGYVEISPGGVFDASYPESKTRRGRVQDNGEVSPTLTAGGEPPCYFEGVEPRILQKPRGFNKGAMLKNCPTITSNSWESINFVYEPNVLTPKRTEYGKALRKDYDAGRIKESRHNMTELEPRKDGISNTITTVQKDNLLVVPEVLGISVHPNSRKLEFKGLESVSEISPTLRATDYKCPHTVWETDKNIVQNYRIRKLTPRECFRFMGVSEEDIDKLQSSGVSKTQQYKMAGNSIVVDVLYYIFKKMFVEKSCEEAQLSLF